MHQLDEETNLTAAGHLDRERGLFEGAERGVGGEVCRVWEVRQPVVVVGRSSRIGEDVNQDACRADNVPILRRSTGGGTVVLGRGCLNYAIVLSLVSRPALYDVALSFRVILDRLAAAIGVPGLRLEGPTDLALDGRKVSGNAQRRGRQTLLHHGTLLYDFDASLAARYLKEPARQPPYRARRRHVDFLGNLPLDGQALRRRLLTLDASRPPGSIMSS